MPKKTTCLLRDLQPPLTEMLVELMASDLERRPFVIVEDVVTKRFVQFARRYKPKTGELLFDVPELKIDLKPCSNAATGAIWAISVLGGELALPSWAEIAMWIDGDPSS